DCPCVMHAANGLLDEPLAPALRFVELRNPNVALMIRGGREQPATADAPADGPTEFDARRAGLGVAGVAVFGAGALVHVADVSWYPNRGLDVTAVVDRV